MTGIEMTSRSTVTDPTDGRISPPTTEVRPESSIRAPQNKMKAYLPCNVLYVFQKLLAASMFLFLLIWVFGHAGGIGWRSEPQFEFNLHPMAMSFGLVFLNGEAITVYRGARNSPKTKTKLIHMVLQLAAGILSIFGLVFAFDSHNFANPPIPNLYSLHSWMGILTVALFVGQWIAGFFVYWLPYASPGFKKRIMPIHRFSGIANFTLVLVSAMMGYSEKAAWLSTKAAPPHSTTLTLANLFGLSMALYGVTVLLVVTNPSWIRQPLPNEVMVPLTQQDRDHDE